MMFQTRKRLGQYEFSDVRQNMLHHTRKCEALLIDQDGGIGLTRLPHGRGISIGGNSTAKGERVHGSF